MFNISPIEIWLLIGFICLIFEFTKFPAIGFLFLGLGALSNGILIYSYPLFSEYQYTSFGLLSFLWLAILWIPLKKYIYKKGKQRDHFDIIGSEVVVYGNNILPGGTGQVKWSGAVMNARLSENEQEEALINQKLYIQQVNGNVLICRKSKE